MTPIINDEKYKNFLDDLKKVVYNARYKAALQVNKELTHLYHYLGFKGTYRVGLAV